MNNIWVRRGIYQTRQERRPHNLTQQETIDKLKEEIGATNFRSHLNFVVLEDNDIYYRLCQVSI